MIQTNTCPEIEEVRRLAREGGSSEDVERLSQHVQICETCAEMFDTMISTDPVWRSLRPLATSPIETDPTALERIQQRLEIATPGIFSGSLDSATHAVESSVLSTELSAISADEGILQFLASPQRPGDLGTLGGYHVLRVLGKGGMGMVFSAEDPSLDRQVALKVMLPKYAANPTSKTRFLREARTAAKLKSDHIVTIHQVSEDRGVPFLAMELLQGMPLDEYLMSNPPLQVKEIVSIGLQVAEGLAAAHEKGLIHRDIKPGNLWLERRRTEESGTKADAKPGVTESFRVKILDFGLARARQDDAQLTQSGAVVGTPAFMAPEQARGDKEIDGRADLFSLGCVLYRLATGYNPFSGDTTMNVLMALAIHNPVSPSKVRDDIPPELSNLILQLLHKDPLERLASADEVIARLRAMEQILLPKPAPVAAAPVPMASLADGQISRATRKPAKRWPTLVGGMVAGLAAAVFGVVLYIQTDRGTLEIKTEDENVKVIVEKNGKQITLGDPISKQTWRLDTGSYTIRLDGNPEGLEIALPENGFEMKRGKTTVVTIRKKAEAVAKLPPMPEAEPKAVPKVVPTAILPTPGKPFVLVRGGKRVPNGEFDSLEKAVLNVALGDVVEVHGNGPFRVFAVQVGPAGLTLKAGAGFRPRLMPSETAKDVNGVWFTADTGPLRFEGIDLICDVPTLNMIHAKGPCEIERCRLSLVDTFSNRIGYFSGPSLRITDSILDQGHSHSSMSFAAKLKASLENNVFLNRSYGYFFVDDPGGQEIRLVRNTFCGGGQLVSASGKLPEPIFVDASRNVLSAWESSPLLRLEYNDASEVTKRVRWKGEGNLYLKGVSRIYLSANEGKFKIDKLADWTKLWGGAEKDSREGPWRAFPFEAFHADAKSAKQYTVAESIEAVREVMERDRPTTYAAAGLDFSIVGPGEAYVKALARDGKPVPKDRLRPAPAAGGPVVVMRDGVDLGGFKTLDEAAAVAADGDVLELRTDESFPNFSRDGRSGKTLTLRAGPGYVPKVNWFFLAKDDVWSIEGVHFLSTLNNQNGNPSAGQIERLANCSFTPIVPWLGGVSTFGGLGGKGKPVELVNCVVPQTLAINHMPTEAQLIFRNSILGQVVFRCKASKQYVQLTSCAFWLPWQGPVLGNDNAKETIYIDARSCWFESVGLWNGPALGTMRWSGDRNVFRMGTAAWGYEPKAVTQENRLADWQKRWKSDANSVEMDPLYYNPQAWRMIPEANATDRGVDVARLEKALQTVRGPEVLVESKTSKPPIAKVAKEKPFVLVRSGQPVREFKSLGGALTDQRLGDVIEVHGDGPFDLAGFDRVDKQLRLKAGPGFRPWFVLRSGKINVLDAVLDIEGCDFDARQSGRLFEGTGSSWEFRGCRFWGAHVIYSGPSIRVADSLILGGYGFVSVGAASKVDIENCLTNAGGAVVTSDPAKASIRLKNNTFALVGFGTPRVVDIPPRSKDSEIVAEGNLFLMRNSQYTGPLFVDYGKSLDAKLLANRIQWRGKENLYAGQWLLDNQGLTGKFEETFANWKKLWPNNEAGSQSLVDFAVEWTRINDMNWDETQAHFEKVVASAKKRHKLAELGPVWNLIGPGEAYVRAREQAEGKPIPRDQIRIGVTDGKPFLLLRAGKQDASFPTLKEAVDSAKDGDVVELRTDFESEGLILAGRKRLLTLRAGLGYSPRIQGLGIEADDRLILEGLHFTSEVGFTTSQSEKGFVGAGELVRMTNCSGPHFAGWIHDSRDKPASITNCFVSTVLHIGLKGSKVRLSNSVVRQVMGDPRAKENADLELDHCLVASQGYGGGSGAQSFWTPQDETLPPLRMAVEKSFIEAPMCLLHVPEKFTWKGRGNVYSPPSFTYSYGHDLFTLDAMRKKYQSDADSIEERSPLLDPAQWAIRGDASKLPKRPDGRDYGADLSRFQMQNMR